MVKYYPEDINISSIMREFPELELVNRVEEQRLSDIEDRKKRGKGAPKKAKTKGVCWWSCLLFVALLRLTPSTFS